jgi:phosphoribosylanthranilate isomerase
MTLCLYLACHWLYQIHMVKSQSNRSSYMHRKILVKVCCISSIAEAKMAISAGASALGLVGNMPSGPGAIEDEIIASIAKITPPPIATFLLTSETNAEQIVAHYRRVNTSTIQIVDELEEGRYHVLRSELPYVKLVQVVHVTDEASVEKAVEVSEFVDAVLLDSGNPNLPVKELGGTGRVHNWRLSRKICESIQVPLLLAGGLNKGNIRMAIETVEPFGIDICSGVRTAGRLDERKLHDFFEELDKGSY